MLILLHVLVFKNYSNDLKKNLNKTNLEEKGFIPFTDSGYSLLLWELKAENWYIIFTVKSRERINSWILACLFSLNHPRFQGMVLREWALPTLGSVHSGCCPRWELPTVGTVRSGGYPQWVLSTVGAICSGGCPQWGLSVVGTVLSRCCPQWELPTVEIVHSGCCPQWVLSTVGAVCSGGCPQWKISVVGSVLSGCCPQWMLSTVAESINNQAHPLQTSESQSDLGTL